MRISGKKKDPRPVPPRRAGGQESPKGVTPPPLILPGPEMCAVSGILRDFGSWLLGVFTELRNESYSTSIGIAIRTQGVGYPDDWAMYYLSPVEALAIARLITERATYALETSVPVIVGGTPTIEHYAIYFTWLTESQHQGQNPGSPEPSPADFTVAALNQAIEWHNNRVEKFREALDNLDQIYPVTDDTVVTDHHVGRAYRILVDLVGGHLTQINELPAALNVTAEDSPPLATIVPGPAGWLLADRVRQATGGLSVAITPPLTRSATLRTVASWLYFESRDFQDRATKNGRTLDSGDIQFKSALDQAQYFIDKAAEELAND